MATDFWKTTGEVSRKYPHKAAALCKSVGRTPSVSSLNSTIAEGLGFHALSCDTVRHFSVLLQNGQRLRFPAKVEISGRMAVSKIQPGAVVRFQASLNHLGQSMGRLAEMGLVNWVIYDKNREKDSSVFLWPDEIKTSPEKYGKSCFKLNYPLKNI